MANKGFLLDSDKGVLLPITRGELILDSSGNQALHSEQFLATMTSPGLMSAEDKKKIEGMQSFSLANSLTLKINSGSVEGTSKYTFDGSTNKILDIIAGSNITLETSAGIMTINGNEYTLYVGDISTKGDSTVASNPYLKLFENSDLSKAIQFRGSGKATVASNNSGVITIDVPMSVDWSDISNVPETFSPKYHTHSTNEIISLEGYKKATENASLTTTDSLNTALGKLEYKIGILGNNFGEYLPLAGGTMTGNITFKEGQLLRWYNSDFYSITCQIDADANNKKYLFLKSTNGVTINNKLSVYTLSTKSPNTDYSIYTDGNSYAKSITLGLGTTGGIIWNNSSSELCRIFTTTLGNLSVRIKNANTYDLLHSGNTYIEDGTIYINGVSITPSVEDIDLSDYVTLSTKQTITGIKTFSVQQQFTASNTSPFTVTSSALVENLNADLIDNLHETDLFVTNRGEVNLNYINTTSYVTGNANFVNYNSGTYLVKNGSLLSQQSIYVMFKASGGTSALELMTNYMDTSRLKIRKTYNNVRVTGPWRELAFVEDLPSVGNGKVTINQSGNEKGSFTMNQDSATIINLDNTWRDIMCNSSSIGTNSLNLIEGNNVSLVKDGGNITISAINNWRPIQCNSTSIADNTLNLKSGSNITLTNSSGNIEISASWRPIYCENTSIGDLELKLMAGDNIALSHSNGVITISSSGSSGSSGYPTTFTWKPGGPSGPTGTLSGVGMEDVIFDAIPSASITESGIVTTGTQAFAGEKTFHSAIKLYNSTKVYFDYSTSYGVNSNYINGSITNLTLNGSTAISFSTGGNSRLNINSSSLYGSTTGAMSLGTISSKFNYVYANYIGSSSNRCIDGYFSGSVRATLGFYESSDERLKNIISPLEVTLDDLYKLRKVYYTLKPGSDRHLGMLAQDIQKLYPELVVTDSDTGYLSLAYDKLSVIALKAIDLLYDLIKDLKEDNMKLTSRIKKLEIIK